MKAKILMLVAMLFMMVLPLFAQTGGTGETDIGSEAFAIVTSVISVVVTQLAKKITYIQNHNWLKILVSVAVGVLVCVISKAIGWPVQFMEYMSWIQALIMGVLAGLSGSGIYDLIKSFFSTAKQE